MTEFDNIQGLAGKHGGYGAFYNLFYTIFLYKKNKGTSSVSSVMSAEESA